MLTVSWSKISMWRRCHRKYWYRYIRGLHKKAPALPLLRGRIIGECLNALAEGSAYGLTLERYATQYRSLLQQEKEMYGDIIEDVRQIIHRYETLYANDPLKYLPGANGKPYELKVEVSLMRGVHFVGYIDKLAQDPEARLWVMDHKSHKTLPDEKARFSDLQLVLYVWAFDRDSVYAKAPSPSGVIWDYIRTKPPTKPELLKNGELTRRKDLDTDHITYLQAIRDNDLQVTDYQDVLDRLNGAEQNFFQRIRLPKPNRTMVNQVVEEIKETSREIKKESALRVRSMDRMCSQCEFYSLCHAELRGLDAYFVEKTEYDRREGDDSREKGSSD